MAQPGHVHIVHPAGADLGGEGVRRVGPARGAQFGPLVGGGRGGGGRRRAVRRRGAAPPTGGDQFAPAAEPGEGVEHGGGDHRVDDVDDGLALVDLAARDGGDEDQDRADDRKRLLPDEQLGQARSGGSREREEGLSPVGDMAAEQLGEVADPAAAVGQQAEKDRLVHREGVTALDGAGATGRSRVPPLPRGEELQRDEAVRKVAVAPQRPQQQRGEQRDQRADQQRPVRDALGLLGRRRGVPVPPDARILRRAGCAQPGVDRGAGDRLLGRRGRSGQGRALLDGRGRRTGADCGRGHPRRGRGRWREGRSRDPVRTRSPYAPRAVVVHEPLPP